jgi:hypothetical protein
LAALREHPSNPVDGFLPMHVGDEALRLIRQCILIGSADTLHQRFDIADASAREPRNTTGKRIAKAAELIARQCSIDPAIQCRGIGIEILAA